MNSEIFRVGEASHDRGRVLPYLFFWGMDSLTEDTVITPQLHAV